MNWDHVATLWKKFNGKICEQRGERKDHELDVEVWDRDQFIDLPKKPFRFSKDEVGIRLDRFINTLDHDGFLM